MRRLSKITFHVFLVLALGAGCAQKGDQGPEGPQGPPGSPDTAEQILEKLGTVDGQGSGLDADTLDGMEASSFVYEAGSGLALADKTFSVNPGVVQSRITGSCMPGMAVTAVDASGAVTCATPFERVIMVRASGTPNENGEELSLKVGMISDSSEDKPYLVKLEPGRYVLPGSLRLPPYVALVGAGESITLVAGANDPQLRRAQ